MTEMNRPAATHARRQVDPHQLGLGAVFFRTRDAVIVADASLGRIVLWNDAAAHMFGYTAAEAVGLLVEDLVPEELKAQHRAGLARYGRDDTGVLLESGMVVELPAVRKDGSQFWVELSLTPLAAEPLASRYAMAMVRDVTDRKASEELLRQSHAVLEGTQALAKVGSWEWDVAAGPEVALRWSTEMYRIHGVHPDRFELSAEAVEALIHPDDLADWQSRLAGCAASGGDLDGFTYRAVHPDGTLRWMWAEGCFLADRPHVLVGFVQDITDQKAIADELARLALYDELTGLRNRRGFLTAAEPLLNVASREQSDLVLLYADLDNMKLINDRHGHDAGDRALAAVASLLRRTFRESDLIARLGGDEFCVLLHGSDVDRPVERLTSAVAGAAHQPKIELSIGAARRAGSETSPIEDLLRRADEDMYRAKAAKPPRRVRGG